MANNENGKTMEMMGEVERLTEQLPTEGMIKDCDTVLADIIMEANHQENGIGYGVINIYEKSKDKQSIKDLFETITGTSFDDYLKLCVDILQTFALTEEEPEKSTWINLGDMNFLAYGGCLVKPHFDEKEDIDESLKYTYDVFYLNTEYGENGDQNFAALCYIDLTDSWIDWSSVMECAGYDEVKCLAFEDLVKRLSPEILAKEAVNYYGVSNFSPSVSKVDQYIQYPSTPEDYTVSEADLKAWLTDIGAKAYV